MLEQIFAGTGLGLLLGLLIGLSGSPVVATVVGALSAGLIALLGFTRKENTAPGKIQMSASSLRLGSFGFMCSVALVAALFVRTNDLLSPPIKTQVSRLTNAGYSPADALRWVALKNVGTSVAWDQTGGKKQTAVSVASSALMSSLGDDDCQTFDPARYKNLTEHLKYLNSRGGRYADFAHATLNLDQKQQSAVLDATKHLFCGE